MLTISRMEEWPWPARRPGRRWTISRRAAEGTRSNVGKPPPPTYTLRTGLEGMVEDFLREWGHRPEAHTELVARIAHGALQEAVDAVYDLMHDAGLANLNPVLPTPAPRPRPRRARASGLTAPQKRELAHHQEH